MEAWGFIKYYTIASWLWANKWNYFQLHHMKLVIERPASSIRRYFLLASSFLFLLPSPADPTGRRGLAGTQVHWLKPARLLWLPFSGVPVYFQLYQHSWHFSSKRSWIQYSKLTCCPVHHCATLIEVKSAEKVLFPLWQKVSHHPAYGALRYNTDQRSAPPPEKSDKWKYTFPTDISQEVLTKDPTRQLGSHLLRSGHYRRFQTEKRHLTPGAFLFLFSAHKCSVSTRRV